MNEDQKTTEEQQKPKGEQPETPENPSDDGKVLTQAQVDQIIANEKRRITKQVEKDLREQITADLTAEAERKAKEQAEEFQPLYEAEKAKNADLEDQIKALQAGYRRRMLELDIREAAQKLRFADADVASKFLDLDQVDYDDDDKPTNIETLLKAVVDEYPYLVAPEPNSTQPVTHTRANAKNMTADLYREQFKQQAQAAGYRVKTG